MIFSEAWEIMKNGGKVTNPDTLDYYRLAGDYIARFDSESGELIMRYEMIPYGFIDRDNWEEVKDEIPEVKIETAPSSHVQSAKIDIFCMKNR